MSKANRLLRLEGLETRTLLAADAADPFGLVADFNLTMHAVSGTGDTQASFNPAFGDHRLVLSGSSDMSVTINLDQLPSFITSLDISSFKNVEMVGTDHIDNLILTSIGSVAAPGLSVNQATVARDVSSLTIAYLGANSAALWGSDMMLTATSLDGTQVTTNLHSLTVTSESKYVMFDFEPRDGAVKDQTLNFTYAPQVVAKYGISNDAIHFMVTPTSNVPTIPTTPTVPVDSGNTGPTTSDSGTTGSGAGTIDPIPSAPTFDPSQVVIVNLALDDHSRALLEQLRALLNSSDADSQQKVLDLLNHANSAIAPSVNPVLASGTPGPEFLLTGGLAPSTHWADAPVNVTLKSVDLTGGRVANFRLDAQSVELLPDLASDVSVSSAVSPVGPKLLDGEVSWPAELLAAAQLESQNASTASATETLLSSQTLGDSVRALGNYIAERVAAEFSPGQQSFVLLVDPQPSRKDEGARKSSADGLLGDFGLPTTVGVTAAA